MYVDSDDYIELDTCRNFIDNLDISADFIVGECREVSESSVDYQKYTNLQDGKTYSSKDYIINSIQK